MSMNTDRSQIVALDLRTGGRVVLADAPRPLLAEGYQAVHSQMGILYVPVGRQLYSIYCIHCEHALPPRSRILPGRLWAESYYIRGDYVNLFGPTHGTPRDLTPAYVIHITRGERH